MTFREVIMWVRGKLSSVRAGAVETEVGSGMRRWGATKPVDGLVDGLNSTSVLVRVLRGKSRSDASPVSDAVNLADVTMSPPDETAWGIGLNAQTGDGARVRPAPRRPSHAATS
jgi:hypothetical protein